ncbi:MAG: xanthine dehydrogenase family protein subunit M [Bacteroidota bacterium]
MIPAAFDYYSPTTLDEAISLLQKLGEDAKILAGGHSLIPMMKLRFADVESVIDINNIPGLSYVKEEDGNLKIGAMTREVELEESAIVQAKYPIFLDAAKLIADPQVRNMGTIGGNIAHGDAANDHPAVMIALGAEVIAQGPNGQRSISIDEFFHGFYMTALEEHEILTELRVPVVQAGTGTAYHKLERKVGDYATAGVAVKIRIDASGTCQEVGIGLTNVNPTPLRATRSENALRGKPVSDATIQEAATYASEDCSPSSDLRGSEAYKRAMVGVLVKRMINKALERAKASL